MKKWETVSKIKSQKSKVKIDDIIKVLLKNRGITTAAQEKEFFNPTHPDKLTPKDFGINSLQLKRAIARIQKAKKTSERVIVWGDYDADGICGSAVLWEALYYSGVNALPFIPERRTEGYGLNIVRMKQLKEEDPSVGLIITVDNGIVAHEKVDTARELGVDVIITDHHVPRATKPRAFAILHTTAISGAGVAWVLAREIKKFDDHLGLVALATIADMVPITGVARSLVYHGLEALRRTNRTGIVALCRQAAIDQNQIGTFEISFILAPRLNAMGRLEHALGSLRLLCVKNSQKAGELAQQLADVNAQRQQLVVDTVLHAREQVVRDPPTGGGLIFIADASYHEGVIGLVASRLVEEFGRPAVVVAKGEEFSKGSSRSVSGFNIVGLLESARQLLVEGGGHSMAAGFTVKTELLEPLSNAFRKHADANLTKEMMSPKLRIDCEIPLSVATLDLAKKIEGFAPFGVGNPEPLFVTRGVMVEDARLVGAENKHLKLQLRPARPAGGTTNYLPADATALQAGEPKTLDAIGFGMGQFYSKLSPDKKIDVAYTIGVDNWNGQERLQLKLRDIKLD